MTQLRIGQLSFDDKASYDNISAFPSSGTVIVYCRGCTWNVI
jgi:hypothetical protein